MLAISRMKTPVALAAGMFLLLGSSPLLAGADRYQLVVAKLEVNLSPVTISFRLPRLFAAINSR